MSWRVQIEEARPSLDRVTPVEAARITDALSAPYIAEDARLPLEHIKTHAPGLYGAYQTIAMLDDSGVGRVQLRENAIGNAWGRLKDFWPNIDKARQHGDARVREFADRLADAAREAFPNRGWERS